MADLDVGIHDEVIAVGESLELSEAQAEAIYEEVREDLLLDVIEQADLYRRPAGYAPRPRSGPVNDDGTTEAR